MIQQFNLEAFGQAASAESLEAIESLIKTNAANERLRTQAAAFGLVLVASQAVGETTFFEDARHVLDEVAKAKARIDKVAWHSLEVVQATGAILLAAQRFVDAETIACTEWPSPREVVESVLEAARQEAGTDQRHHARTTEHPDSL